MLRGREEEARYTLHDSGLTVSDVVVNGHGDVSRLVPPAENIHRVTNACDGVAISLHVYGADIAARGTSVNQVFDHAVTASAGGAPRSWRSTGELPRHQGVDVDPAGITIAPHPSSTPERPSERAAARRDGHARGE